MKTCGAVEPRYYAIEISVKGNQLAFTFEGKAQILAPTSESWVLQDLQIHHVHIPSLSQHDDSWETACIPPLPSAKAKVLDDSGAETAVGGALQIRKKLYSSLLVPVNLVHVNQAEVCGKRKINGFDGLTEPTGTTYGFRCEKWWM